MERNGEIMAEQCTVECGGHSSSPLKQISDSVVYKLVRVEGDGTLVPATDEDVIEVEHMLQDNKKECMDDFQDLVSDPVSTPSRKSDMNSLEGSSLTESSAGTPQQLKARFEYVESMLRKVKEEEKLLLSGEITESSIRDVSLDSLTIRELQEAFIAKFGQPTSVKDKQWLVRRLSTSDGLSSKTLPRKRTSPTGLDPPPAAKRMRKPTRRYIEECAFSESPDHECRKDELIVGGGKEEEMGSGKKRHRVWSLWEVTRLVDGVSKYGAGRWSEIKRLVFASHSHRTSVDLKDKWRNLLKACFTERPAVKKNNSMRPNTTAPPIPAWVLARVRELAENSTPGASPSP